MPNRLTDIHVDFVSFVGKAAVRDPQKPDQPRRFILYKAESGKDDQMARQGVLKVSDADVLEGQAERDRLVKRSGRADEYGIDPAVNEGRASEVAVTDDHRAKARAALRELGDDPLFGGALAQLQGVADGTDGSGEDAPDTLEKAMLDLYDHGTHLAKAESPSPVAQRAVRKAERSLMHEYGMRESVGVRNAVQRREQCLKDGIPIG